MEVVPDSKYEIHDQQALSKVDHTKRLQVAYFEPFPEYIEINRSFTLLVNWKERGSGPLTPEHKDVLLVETAQNAKR